MNQRGFGISLILWGLAALAIVTAVGAVVWKYNSAIERAVKAEAQLAEVRRLGEEQEKRTQAEMARQKRVSDETIKSLQTRYAGLNARYAKLRKQPAGASVMPAVPDSARPTTDTARDQRLLDLLQYADQQTQQLIELQNWVREQAK